MKRLMYAVLFLFSLVFSAEGNQIKVYVLNHPITNQRILPKEPIFVPVSSRILMLATPGEYEPASFVLNSSTTLQGVTVKISKLKGDDSIIPPDSFDIKIVKCWYQVKPRGYTEKTPARTYRGTSRTDEKVLVPELLLNDDSLIKVDYEKKKNFLKIKDPEKGERYIDISVDRKKEEVEKELPRGYDRYTFTNLIKDSPQLLPFQLKKNENKQIWLTLKVPDKQKPGIYTGEVEVKKGKVVLAKIPLKVRILPFKLGKSHSISSIYYWAPSKKTYKEKVWEQFEKEMKDLIAHGVTSPAVACQNPSLEDFEEWLKIREKLGIGNQPLFCLWPNNLGFYLPRKPSELEKLKKKVKSILEITEKFKIPEVYFYGIDEAKGEKVAAERPAWEAIHEAGGKVYVAGYTAKVHPPGNFALVGDLQDLFVCNGYPSRKEAENWHKKGHKIVCYANPYTSLEAPETYRRNYGILLWQYNYDGAMDFCYSWTWRDGIQNWTDHIIVTHGPIHLYKKAFNMVYETANGVIDTLQWEGYREGIDDVRYLNVLIDEIEKKKGTKVAREAKEFVDKLKQGDINKDIEDMDFLRLKIIKYIMKLKGV